MATSIKISQLPAKGSNLEATDLLEVSEFNGTGYVSKSITGAEIVASIPPTSVEWGDIGGTLSAQTDLNTALSGKVPTSRTLTINGTTQDLSADRTFTISTGITIGTTAITSGTIGRVLFEGTGNVVSESANLFWDNTNGLRAGVSLLGTWSVSNLYARFGHSSYNTSTNFGFLQANNGECFMNGPINYINAQSLITFQISGSNKMYIPSTGNVLINTTTDAGFKLDVNGTARVVNQATIQTLTIGLGGGAVATNTALGLNALTSNSTGANNTSVGSGSLRANTIGDYNTSVGLDALRFNTGGGQNTAVGWRALNSVLTGYGNVAVGAQALISTTGGFNIGIGERAGESNTTGTYNICIGAQTQTGNFSNSVILGRSATATASNQFVVGTATYNVGSVTTEVNVSTQVWNVIINGVARKILLA